MGDQSAVLGEGLVTNFTLVGLLPSVGPHVSLEVVSFGKSTLALSALEGPLPGVCSQMNF